MAYRIEYGPAVPPKYQRKPALLRIQTMTAAFFLIFVLIISQFFPTGTAVLRQYIQPSEPTVTQAAFSGLLADIRNGIALQDAFTAFCVQIISYDDVLSG